MINLWPLLVLPPNHRCSFLFISVLLIVERCALTHIFILHMHYGEFGDFHRFFYKGNNFIFIRDMQAAGDLALIILHSTRHGTSQIFLPWEDYHNIQLFF